jgi:cytochrome c peroxidase
MTIAAAGSRSRELRYGLAMSGRQRPWSLARLLSLTAVVAAAASGACAPDTAPPAARRLSPEAALGKRLFRETRFAQHFAARAGGDMNRVVDEGDPALAFVATGAGDVAGPYRGLSMNCAACHLSDELASTSPERARSFADFSPRSPLPDRGDGRRFTARNAAALMGTLSDPPGSPLHFDGEHATGDDLVQEGLTGRNFGWLPEERAQAVAHAATVLRRDDGSGPLAAEFGRLPYRVVFAGRAPQIPPTLRLPDGFRIDVDSVSDDRLLAAVARAVNAYLATLTFARDADGTYSGSPYDRFLRKNGLPIAPAPDEKIDEYGRRLFTGLIALRDPAFVTEADGRFARHRQPFLFGPTELLGLVTFLGQPGDPPEGPPGTWACSTCHPPPHFTDYNFHNTGVAQLEYDRMHGDGSFAALAVPDLDQRRQEPAAFLPPSPRSPGGTAIFRQAPDKERPGRVDLGVWNVLANDDLPGPQAALQAALCPLVADLQGRCDIAQLLPLTVGMFKTRSLRNLGHSGPYFHNGQATTLEQTVTHYLQASLAMKNAQLRSGDIAMEWLQLSSADVAPLTAFLRSLNED